MAATSTAPVTEYARWKAADGSAGSWRKDSSVWFRAGLDGPFVFLGYRFALEPVLTLLQSARPDWRLLGYDLRSNGVLAVHTTGRPLVERNGTVLAADAEMRTDVDQERQLRVALYEQLAAQEVPLDPRSEPKTNNLVSEKAS